MLLKSWLDSYLYPGHDGYWAEKRFRSYILERLREDYVILDLGAGRGECEELNFRGLVRFVAGVDLDPIVHKNPFLDEARTLSLSDWRIPYDDNTFDLIFTNCVLEHIQDPEVFFKEVYRVLKPNRLFLSKTPNLWHYAVMISCITPHWFHVYLNQMRGVEPHHIFPTFQKCNTPRAVRKLAKNAGFKLIEMQMWEGRPEYLRLWTLTYLLGYLYERAVNKFSFLSRFRVVMVFELRKPVIGLSSDSFIESMHKC